MNLHALAANLAYHERCAEAAADRKLALTHRNAARLLRTAYDAAHLDHIQRQALTEQRQAAARQRQRSR
jgi:hypothetical protein